MEPNIELVKIGRSTGFTAGRLDGVRTTTLHSWERDEAGDWIEVLSKVYCVVPIVGCTCEPTFGKQGDSGSFVMNNRGSFVGLLVGSNHPEGAAYLLVRMNWLRILRGLLVPKMLALTGEKG